MEGSLVFIPGSIVFIPGSLGFALGSWVLSEGSLGFHGLSGVSGRGWIEGTRGSGVFGAELMVFHLEAGGRAR